MMNKIYLLLIYIFLFSPGFSQPPASIKKYGWHLLDQELDGYMGISLNKAYELLKGRKSYMVVVAVIDSGIDTLQEDLQTVLWHNEKEIPGNGMDDDHNGYVDDHYGWNFCGGKNGMNQVRNSHEAERVYHHWKQTFEGKKEKEILPDQQYLYGQWVHAASLINKDYEEATRQLPKIKQFQLAIEKASQTICDHLNVSDFGKKQVLTIASFSDETLKRSAGLWLELFTNANDTTTRNKDILKEIQDFKNDLDHKISLKLQEPEDWRGEVVKDHYLDINDRFYGNNNLKAGSGDHGTMVAGTIAAIRNNGIGIDGIADHVQIMSIRAVPGGDEHDKDIALAIRYAVDNGAGIINMSFGKPISPYKVFVDDAVRYAASRGVLLVHAAGNDGVDLTQEPFYPNPLFLEGSKASNFLTVGASGDVSTGGYAAPFSNYSRSLVDLFAPGMNIYATASENRYVSADGTSLACPVVSGIAALLKSYFPNLTPEKIIYILTTSGRAVNEAVQQPGQENKRVPFSSLSSSGKVVNAYEAVKLAIRLEKNVENF